MQNISYKLRNAGLVLKDQVRTFKFWAVVSLAIIALAAAFLHFNLKTVYINDGDTTILRRTLEKDPGEILSDSGIKLMAFDVMDFTGFEGKMGVINIERAFPVSLSCDGENKRIMTTEVTVREFLQNNGVILGANDKVNMPVHFYLSKGDRVEITRVRDSEEIKIEEIPFTTEYVKTPLLRNGRQRLLSYGIAGEKQVRIKNTMEDGEVVASMRMEEEVVREPVPQKVLIGADVPASTYDFGIELDEYGNPKHYKKVLRNQVCTGYSSPTGYRYKGASGMRLYPGCVAVRSSEIPYGTKMYIKSPDGGFVYGCAVAADTGTGLMDNVIDFDLYYDTYRESCLNGRKYLDVYILE